MKHSENLKKFLTKPRNKHYQRVYLKKTDDEGRPVTAWRPPHIFIGLNDDDWVHGARLASLLIGDMQTWAFPIRRSQSHRHHGRVLGTIRTRRTLRL